jgi:hypothetical protein
MMERRSFRRNTMRASRLVVLGLAIAGAPLAAQQKMPGWTFTMNTTVDSGGGHIVNFAMRISATDSKLRQEWVQMSGIDAPMSIEGMYMVMSAGDSTMTSVMPQQRMATISKFPPDGFDASQMSFINHTTSQIEDLGDGGKIFGHATRRYRVTTTGTVERHTATGKVCTIPADGVSEMWIAPDMDLTAALAMMTKQFGFGADQVVQGTHTQMPRGLPLRIVTRNRGVTSTMEYRDIAQTSFDASYFDPPSDYHVMDMRKMERRIPKALMDSVRQAMEDKTETCPGGRP